MKRRIASIIGICSLAALRSIADETLVVSSLLIDSSIATPVLRLRVDLQEVNRSVSSVNSSRH